MTDTLKEKTAKGLFWGALNSSFTQALNLIIGICLARLLSPDDYGIVGVLAIFTAIAGNLQDSGFTQGLINLKVPTKRDYNSVFWFNVLSSALIYVVLFLSAPLIAWFFHKPELTALSRVLFLTFFITSTGIANSAYMKKNMMNRELAVSSVVALAGAGCIGISLAFAGFAYWSLVWQQISYVFLLTLCRFLYTPRLVGLHVDFGPVKKMFNFSVKIMLTNIINTISSNVLTFVFGYLYPMKAVGNFSQAYKWDNMANSLVANTVGQIAQPVMVSVRNEPGREMAAFRKMMRFTALLSFPAMFGLTLVAREFIFITIGEKWADSVVLLQILCISGAFYPFYTLYQNLIISIGRSDVYLWCNIGQVVLQLAVVIALHSCSMVVMVCAYSAMMILWLLVWQHFAGKLAGVRLADTCKDVFPFCLAAMLTMSITGLATSAIGNIVVLLIARILLAAVVYSVIMTVCRVEIFRECVQFLKKKLFKKAL